jgi:hypothetical protein
MQIAHGSAFIPRAEQRTTQATDQALPKRDFASALPAVPSGERHIGGVSVVAVRERKRHGSVVRLNRVAPSSSLSAAISREADGCDKPRSRPAFEKLPTRTARQKVRLLSGGRSRLGAPGRLHGDRREAT